MKKSSETKKTHTCFLKIGEGMMQMEIEMCDTECLGQIQLREKWRRQWTVTKIRGKMLRKILKTLFEMQSTHFLRLKWVANKSPGLAAKTLKEKIVKNFLSVFRN